GRQSFPVLICDRMLGSVAGTELVRQVRCISIEPVYVLMMSDASAAEEINSVYCAGVDQFMPRSISASVLKDRVQAAFKAISLRRISRIIGHREIVTVDLASGAHTARHLVGRLGAEIELAHSAAGTLEIAIIRVGSAHRDSTLPEDLLAVLEAVQMSLRPRFDWVAWLHPTGHIHRLAVVMPNAGRGGAAALEQHVRNAFALETSNRPFPEISFGHVLFEQKEGAVVPMALSLIAQAEQQLRAIKPMRAVGTSAELKDARVEQTRQSAPS
ncbi:MAG: hypothetical protein ABW110_13700, partial [Steroidobacteraceae bacterium]